MEDEQGKLAVLRTYLVALGQVEELASCLAVVDSLALFILFCCSLYSIAALQLCSAFVFHIPFLR